MVNKIIGSRFMDKPSEKYVAAVQALKILAEDKNEDPSRAYAEAVSDEKLQAFQERYGLKRSEGHACLRRLMGRRCSSYGETGKDGIPCLPPGADHNSLWNYKGKPAVFVTQPYDMGWVTVAALVDLCRELKLEMCVNSVFGWYFPGRASCIQIWRPDVYAEIMAEKIKKEM